MNVCNGEVVCMPLLRICGHAHAHIRAFSMIAWLIKTHKELRAVITSLMF